MHDVFAITTQRLVLREFTTDDCAAVQRYANDEAVVRFMPWGPNSEAETEAFLERAIGCQTETPRVVYEVAVTQRDTGELIGGCGLRLTRREEGEGEIGYVLRRDCWGQGFMAEAVQGMCAFVFDALALHRLTAITDPQNIASARVLEKCGFQLEGCLRDHMVVKGERRSSLVYGLLAPEWQARERA